MSQVTGAITLANGAATPVNKTFSPEAVAPELSTFTERSAASSNGFLRLSVSYSAASPKRATNRVAVNLAMPIVETVSGINQVTRTLRFDGTFIVPDSALATERADLHAYVVNALQNALLKGVVKDLDPLY